MATITRNPVRSITLNKPDGECPQFYHPIRMHANKPYIFNRLLVRVLSHGRIIPNPRRLIGQIRQEDSHPITRSPESVAQLLHIPISGLLRIHCLLLKQAIVQALGGVLLTSAYHWNWRWSL